MNELGLRKFITAKQLRQYLGWSNTTLWKHTKTDPAFPTAYRRGRDKIFFLDDVEKYVNSLPSIEKEAA